MKRGFNTLFPTKLYYEKVFSETECNEIVEHSQNIKETNGSVGYFGDVNHEYRKTTVKYFHIDEGRRFVYDKIIKLVKYANEDYYQEPIFGMSEFQYMEYNENDHFTWHMDVGGKEPFSFRKLSLVIFLSNPDNYQGGQLEWLPASQHTIPQEQGCMVIFPSTKMHRVTPVTKGIRRTLVVWAYGK